jgi:hypothetical protein
MNKADRLVLKLINEVLNEYIFEAEEEGNPFAAAGGAGGGDKADAGADADAGAEEEKDKEKKAAPAEDVLSFKFDISAAKKYNTANFRNDTAVAKKITKNGILATVKPDDVDILIGFDDITEAAKDFFKTKK